MIEPVAAEPRRFQSPWVTSAAIGACLGLLLTAVLGVRLLAASQEEAAFRPAVDVATAQRAPIRAELLYSGTVQGSQQATVNSSIAGTLSAVLVQPGSVVRAGDRLAALDPGALPAQLQQARADLQSAEAKRALVAGGATSVDIGAAQAQLSAAQAKLDQLLNPSPADIAAATAAVSAAQTAVATADNNVENARAVLLGAFSTGCTGTTGIGLPCGNIQVPLTQDAADNVTSFLQTRAGDPRSDLGARAVAVLTANAAYKSGVAAAASARDAVKSAQARLDTLRNPTPADISAQRALVEAARNALDRRLNAYTDADMQAANATVAQAQAAVALAQANLNRMTILAPFDGVVAQRLAEPGVNVGPQAPLLLLIGKAAEVHVTVRDADAAVLKNDAPAELSIPGDNKNTLRGKVSGIAAAGDARAHTFDVKIIVDDPQALLKAGTLTQVRIVTAQKPDVLVVPTSAVFELSGAQHVFVVADGKLKLRTVEVGLVDRTGTEVTKGLQPGEVVVLSGQRALRDGQGVRPSPVATATPAARS